MAGRDGGQSRRAGRRPRAGEMTGVLLTLSVAGVFLQLVIKLWICSRECVVRLYLIVIPYDVVSLLPQTDF